MIQPAKQSFRWEGAKKLQNAAHGATTARPTCRLVYGQSPILS